MTDTKSTVRFKRGDKVKDRDGFKGVVTLVTHYNGSHWYDVKFSRGEAVRYESDLEFDK